MRNAFNREIQLSQKRISVLKDRIIKIVKEKFLKQHIKRSNICVTLISEEERENGIWKKKYS